MVTKSEIFGSHEDAYLRGEVMVRASMHHNGYVALKKALRGPFVYRGAGAHVMIDNPYKTMLIGILIKKSRAEGSSISINALYNFLFISR